MGCIIATSVALHESRNNRNANPEPILAGRYTETALPGLASSVDPTNKDITLAELTSEPSVYLIPESGTDERLMRNLRKFCAEIFVEELDAWYRDEEVWPQDRSFNVFRLWFEYKHHSLVFDVSSKPLIRE